MSRNKSLIIVGVITALAFGLRLINLGHSDLIFDEAASVFIARKPLAEMLPYLLRAFHEHPPGYYVLLAGWIQLVGDGEVVLRMLSVFFGTVSIPLIYRWAREAIDERVGIVAALVLSVTPVHVFFSQNARMYTLIGVLALLSWWLILRLQKHDRVRYWVALAACGLYGLASHYYMGFVIASQAVYLLVTWRQNKRLFLKWLMWLGIPLALAALYVIASPGVMGTLRAMFKRGLGSEVTIGSLRALAADLVFGPHGNLGINVWSIVIIAVVIGIGLAFFNRGAKRSVSVMLACAIGVPLILVTLIPEALTVRYVLFLLFPMILALTIVIALPFSIAALHRWKWLPSTILLGALVALNVSRLPVHYDVLTSEYGRTIDFVRANVRSGDGVIFNGPWQFILQQYYPIGDVPSVYLPPQSPPFLDPQATEPILNEWLARYQRLWVIPLAVDQSDPNRFVAGWLNQHAHHALEEANVALYYAPSKINHTVVSTPIRFGEALTLIDAAMVTDTLEAGDAALATLTWRALQPIDGDVQVNLEVIDQNGSVWGQRLYQPGEYFVTKEAWNAGQPTIDRQAIPIDPGAPPGDYYLRASVQRASTGEAWPPIDQPDPDYAALTPLHITVPRQPIADDQVPGARVDVRFDDRLALIAYHLPTPELVQGGVVPITLYWRALNGDRNVNVDVTLVDSSGQVIDASSGPLGPRWYRASQWSPNQVAATSAALRIPPRLKSGVYHLQVTMRDRVDQPIQASGAIDQPGLLSLWTEHVTSERDTWTLGDVSIVARDRNFTIPAIQRPLSVKFNDQIQLLGYDLDASNARSGGQLRVKFYWQALKDIDQNYVVFTHLMDATEQKRGQRDSMPVGGLNPTPFWQQGEVIADEYAIDIAADAPPGQYHLNFGWYESDTDTRLPAIDVNGNRYLNDIVTIPDVPITP